MLSPGIRARTENTNIEGTTGDSIHTSVNSVGFEGFSKMSLFIRDLKKMDYESANMPLFSFDPGSSRKYQWNEKCTN